MKTESNKKGFFYGWVIVAAGLLLMTTIGGIAWNCVGLFIKPVCEDLGISRGAMGVNSTITSLMNMAVGLAWGFLLQRFSIKKMMRLSVFTLPAAYFCYSLAQNIFMFYACSFVVGLSLALLMFLPLAMIISNWFNEKRGLAFGIAFMGSGLGGMIFNPIAFKIITDFGWRAAYRILSVVMFVSAFIAVFFLIKLRPEEMGLKPLGYGKNSAEDTQEDEELQGEMFRDLIKTTRFRLVALAIASMSATACIAQCLAPHMSDCGYSPATAAMMVSLGMGSMAVGKMVLGSIYDRFGTRRATLLSITCGAIGILGMIFCRAKPALAAICLGQGLGCSFGTIGVPIVAEKMFGKKDYGANFGFLDACSCIGAAFQPIINGTTYDVAGSYNPAFAVWVLFMVFAAAVFAFYIPKGKKALKR